jgi:hypothetical protein
MKRPIIAVISTILVIGVSGETAQNSARKIAFLSTKNVGHTQTPADCKTLFVYHDPPPQSATPIYSPNPQIQRTWSTVVSAMEETFSIIVGHRSGEDLRGLFRGELNSQLHIESHSDLSLHPTLHLALVGTLHEQLESIFSQLNLDDQFELFSEMARFSLRNESLRLSPLLNRGLAQFSETRLMRGAIQRLGIFSLARLHHPRALVTVAKTLIYNTQLGDGTEWVRLSQKLFNPQIHPERRVVLRQVVKELRQQPQDELVNGRIQADYIEQNFLRPATR